MLAIILIWLFFHTYLFGSALKTSGKVLLGMKLLSIKEAWQPVFCKYSQKMGVTLLYCIVLNALQHPALKVYSNMCCSLNSCNSGYHEYINLHKCLWHWAVLGWLVLLAIACKMLGRVYSK